MANGAVGACVQAKHCPYPSQHLKVLDSIPSVPFHISGVRDRARLGAVEGKAGIAALVTKALFCVGKNCQCIQQIPKIQKRKKKKKKKNSLHI